MNVYMITRGVEDLNPMYRGTFADAHDLMKTIPDYQRDEARCELIDMKTDKDSLIELLATGKPLHGGPLRTWIITSRGGMREVPNGE